MKDLVSLYVNDISWGVDFLVVDESHTLISFPITRGVRQLRFAIAYRDQPKIAQDIAEWYDEFLLRGSYTYEEFTKKYPPETIQKG